MKQYIFGLTLLLLSIITMSNTCNKGGGSLELTEGETTTRKLVGGDYAITVTNITDNRCPKDVKCIRAGEAIVEVAIEKPLGSLETLRFCTGLDCRMQNIDDVLLLGSNENRYELKLVTVTPYPTQGSGDGTKTANFTIRKI